MLGLWKFKVVLSTIHLLLSGSNLSASGLSIKVLTLRPYIEYGHFYWMFGLVLLEMITILLLFAVVKKTKRWNGNTFFKKVNSLVLAKSSSFAMLYLFCTGIALLLTVTRVKSLIGIQSLIAFFTILINCLLLLWFVRNLQRVVCPHCQQSFTRKQIFKMTWTPYRLKCIHCQRAIFLSEASRKRASLYVLVPLLSFYGLGFLGIPFPIIAFSFVVVAIFFNVYINLFTTSFSKEDEPLW
ncbi:hypothetical protein D1B33_06435 [Lysinibacillus yapensis]|uniref:CXXC-20-CXXC protein n=1 Tax=Ureibacillus yapensis TaxID=2304605 RepID=A0A396SBK4_9BACL|nr:hypothetical protein D1B33_06435 [Lysinibacillus yapensis]